MAKNKTDFSDRLKVRTEKVNAALAKVNQVNESDDIKKKLEELEELKALEKKKKDRKRAYNKIYSQKLTTLKLSKESHAIAKETAKKRGLLLQSYIEKLIRDDA